MGHYARLRRSPIKGDVNRHISPPGSLPGGMSSWHPAHSVNGHPQSESSLVQTSVQFHFFAESGEALFPQCDFLLRVRRCPSVPETASVTVARCQPWSYRRLGAYSFFWVMRGGIECLKRLRALGTPGLASRQILSLDPCVSRTRRISPPP